MLTAGADFAGYRIERVLGAGGMGTVYLARRPDLPQSEAVKVLNADLSRDPDFRARFLREADIAATLKHPNIVSVHRRGEFEGELWIAMRFVPGINADEAVRAGAMPPARAVHVVAQVARAIDFAHSRGVVHRDIKPANFLLSGPVGANERVFLSDFGIARALGDAALTTTGSFLASVPYAAPEVLAGHLFDGRADLYSLGCTLFGLLTGKAPFAGADGMAAAVAAHLQQPPPKVTDRVPDLPASIDDVIATAMAKDPARRFASASELAQAAADALREPVAARQPAPASPGPTTTYGGPYTGGGIIAPAPHPDWPRGPAIPLPRRNRRRRVAAAVAVIGVLVGVVLAGRALTTPSHPGNSGQPAVSTIAATPPLPPNPPPSPVPLPALDGLLLPPEQVAAIIGAPKLIAGKTVSKLYDDSALLAEKECVGLYAVADHPAYADSGWTAARVQSLNDTADGHTYHVVQGVIAFPSAHAAAASVADQQRQWSACSRRTLTVNQRNGKALWDYGPLTDAEATLSITAVQQGTVGWGCQRALAARNNVVVDVIACRQDVVNQGVDILNAIATKIP